VSEIHLQTRKSKRRCACCHDDDDGLLEECICGAEFHADCGPCPTIGCDGADDDDDEELRKLFALDSKSYPASNRSRSWEPQYLGICGGCGRGRMPGPRGWSATKCGKCQAIAKSWAEHAEREAFWDPIANLLMYGTLAVVIIFANVIYYLGTQ
jgi:hypothetical protein